MSLGLTEHDLSVAARVSIPMPWSKAIPAKSAAGRDGDAGLRRREAEHLSSYRLPWRRDAFGVAGDEEEPRRIHASCNVFREDERWQLGSPAASLLRRSSPGHRRSMPR
jgi:hypothetical protein